MERLFFQSMIADGNKGTIFHSGKKGPFPFNWGALVVKKSFAIESIDITIETLSSRKRGYHDGSIQTARRIQLV